MSDSGMETRTTAADGVHDLFSRHDPARPTGKKMEYAQFRKRHLNWLALDKNFMTARVDLYVMNANRSVPVGRRGALAPEHRAHSGNHDLHAEGLGYVVIGPELEPGNDGVVLAHLGTTWGDGDGARWAAARGGGAGGAGGDGGSASGVDGAASWMN